MSPPRVRSACLPIYLSESLGVSYIDVLRACDCFTPCRLTRGRAVTEDYPRRYLFRHCKHAIGATYSDCLSVVLQPGVQRSHSGRMVSPILASKFSSWVHRQYRTCIHLSLVAGLPPRSNGLERLATYKIEDRHLDVASECMLTARKVENTLNKRKVGTGRASRVGVDAFSQRPDHDAG